MNINSNKIKNKISENLKRNIKKNFIPGFFFFLEKSLNDFTMVELRKGESYTNFDPKKTDSEFLDDLVDFFILAKSFNFEELKTRTPQLQFQDVPMQF